jgi:hypothetical protein
MADPVKFKISSIVAAFVRPGVSSDQKLSGLERCSRLEPLDRVTLVYCLMKDVDAVVKRVAGALFAELPEDVILKYIDALEVHPSILDALARVHHAKPWVAQALLGNVSLSAPARTYLQGGTVSTSAMAANPPEIEVDKCPEVQISPDDSNDPVLEGDIPDEASDEMSDAIDDTSEEEIEEVDEDGDKFLSKYKVAMVMGISEKIKMALSGDKEWRSILIKDSNKLVSGSVIKNPRITDGEILTILKVGVQNDEIIRLICANKEWTKNYMIRKALIDCPKTPLPNSLRYLASLNEKDIASYAKSKNISSVLSTQAKRLLLAKKR